MYLKLLTFLFLLVITINVFSATITTLEDDTLDNATASCALLRGEITRELKDFEENILEKVDTKLTEQNKVLEESTNPLRQSFPTILFLAVIIVIWGILKAKGKV